MIAFTRHRQLVLPALLALGSITTSAFAKDTAQQMAGKTALVRFYAIGDRSLEKKQLAFFDQHMTADFIFKAPDGKTYTRSEYLTLQKMTLNTPGTVIKSSHTHLDKVVWKNGKAVVTVTGIISGSQGGAPFHSESQSRDTWRPDSKLGWKIEESDELKSTTR